MPPTAYAKAMKAAREDTMEKRRNKGVRRQVKAAGGAKCGAKKHGGGTCGQAAGFGTTHKGIGRCKFHGGSAPNGIKNAAKQEAILLGAPKEINPLDAIIWCIKLTSGEIDFYTEQMAELERRDWLEETVLGKQMHVFARERALCQERLVKFSKDAISLGLTERAVRLAEQYGNTLARLLGGLLEDLKPFLSEEGIKIIPVLIRKHLLLAESGGMAAIQTTKALTA